MAYKMTHPNSSAEIEVAADAVDTYASQGWEMKAPESDEGDE